MARAGDRYSETTGNIWSYANRGDMTGLKAALMRNVDVNMINTVGWTPLHAAAAGGQTRALHALLRAGADITIRDRGGNLAAHEAARGGHLQCLEALVDAGVDVSSVRLSQTKGAAVRDFVLKGSRSATKAQEGAEDEPEAKGYERRQQKSTAFWGPRRTPVGNKIKREIIKEKRNRRAADALAQEASAEEGAEPEEVLPEADDDALPAATSQHDELKSSGNEVGEVRTVPAKSYSETVRAVKHQTRCSRKARQGAKGKESQSEETSKSEEIGKEVEPLCNKPDTASAARANGFLALNENSADESG